MRRHKMILLLLLLIILTSTNPLKAMYKAQINEGEKSISFNLQSYSGEIKAYTIESDFSLSPTLGLLSMYHHSNDNKLLNLDLKITVSNEDDYDISLLGGYQFDLDDKEDNRPKIGILGTQQLSRGLDVNAGANVLLKESSDILGFEFGFNYMLTRDLYLEGGFRRLAGAKGTEGLLIGIRNYF